MKQIFIVLLLAVVNNVEAQESDFFAALQTNNYGKVSTAMDNQIELCIMEDQDLYSKRVAIQKINSWVKQKNIREIKEVHTGESNDKKSHYKVARVYTSEGQYRVFVYVHRHNNKELIKKIQIDIF